MRTNLYRWLAGAVLGGCIAGLAAEFPLQPYIDPAQLDVPWPKHSHYRQPWRAFLETRSGDEFRRGIGINFNVPDQEALAARLLAEAGFRAARIEIGWGQVAWDESGLNDTERIQRRLQACRTHGLRPTILLNAHHGVPCPARFFERHLAADAAAGARVVHLDSLADIVPGRTGLSNLTDYKAAEVFITAIDAAAGACSLSRPLPKALKSGDTVLLATLRYLPAHPVGTPEFEEMAAGWERYTDLVLAAVAAAGVADADVEIWNELSFGSCFMGTHGINEYYDPPKVPAGPDFLNPGGHAWEIARRTVQRVRRTAPAARCIWGFSNTTFFHTPVERLPPGVAGQTYHPYGTGTRSLPDREQAPDAPQRCLEGFVPRHEMRLPEGWAQTFVQTESLMRLLNPEARARRPAGSPVFLHYMTEHGVAPGECGVATEAGAWDLKAGCALRAFCFWLGKGISVMHFYCAYDQDPKGMGLLPPGLAERPDGEAFEQAATPPLRALRRLTALFAGSVPVVAPAPLTVMATALAEGRQAFAGDAGHPPLWERDLLVVQPFQCTPEAFVVAAYVMTYDATSPMPDLPYRLVLGGLPPGLSVRQFHEPLGDRDLPLAGTVSEAGILTLDAPLSDTPRLLVIGRP